MFYIASTRFNATTYQENWKYRHKHKIGVIYGTPIKIRDKYPANSVIVVIEMNNDTNQIEGIGVIRNKLVYDSGIYSNSNYNRYMYAGKHWISRTEIKEITPKLVEILEKILFKGKSHMKRLVGITIITPKLFRFWSSYNYADIEKEIKELFKWFQSKQET